MSKQTYSSGQKPWVKGSLDEAGHVNLGSGPVAVKGDGSFEGQAPARTTTITAKDSAGNSTTETWQLNSGSGATPDATFTYTHDSEGNLLGDGTSSFEWDLRNRLTAIVTGTHRTELTYDGSDRRVRVVEKESGTVTSDLRYIYQGLSLLEERAANNSTVLRRFYAGGHVDVANGGTRYAYTTDHLGSLREVIQLDGTTGNPTTATLTARYDYDLWGKRTVLDGGTAAETLVMHGYTGHIRHAWSGLWLAPYRAYNSGLGRWISRDPIAEDGGINLYGYVGNGVMVAIDPLGLITNPWQWWFGLNDDQWDDALGNAAEYLMNFSPLNSVYGFAGAEFEIGAGLHAEGLVLGGLDMHGEGLWGAGLGGIGIGPFTGAWECSTDGHSEPLLLLDFGHTPEHFGLGGFASPDEVGLYLYAPGFVPGMTWGLGAAFDRDKLPNYLDSDYWFGRMN